MTARALLAAAAAGAAPAAAAGACPWPLCACALGRRCPPYGPFAVDYDNFTVGGLKARGSQKASVWYPSPAAAAPPGGFPVVSFAHGAPVGGSVLLPIAYGELLHGLASWGFVVVAPDSCVPPTGWACYKTLYQDQLHVLAAAAADPAVHPAFARADFARAGLMGHSYGADATVLAAAAAAPNVSAAVILHPASDDGSGVAVPSLTITGSADLICPPAGGAHVFSTIPARPKLLLELKGATHMEPTRMPAEGGNRMSPSLTMFLACHLRAFNADAACDYVYGADGDAVCRQGNLTLTRCEVVGRPEPATAAPAPAPAPAAPGKEEAPGAGCIADTSAGLHRRVRCGAVPIPSPWGHDFRVTYNVPARCAGGGCGLIVDVHGGSMDADQQDANTDMRALGEQHGYVVAQPTAPPGVMPINNWGWKEEVVQASADAVFAWVREAVAKFRADPARVHFMGFSEGAGMTWRMLCQHADVFASVVVIEGNAGGAGSDCEFTPGMRQIPVLLQSGVYDVPENFAGAQRTVRALTAAWGAAAGVPVAGDATYNRTRYVGSAGAPLEFIEHTYIADYILLGHCFPGSNDTSFTHHTAAEAPFFGPFGCPGALSKRRSSYFIGAEAMEWFVRHPLRAA